MSNFWDFIWLILSSFIFIAYLLVLFQIVGDLFRNTETRSIYKAFWIVGLIFVPMLTALIYIVRHGAGMASRQRAAIEQAKSDTDAYIREVAGKSSVEQIGEAKALLDSGAITAEEFAQLKAKALA
jgi:Short C-terminal domain/Phospholipase_D-nuclease N-terminal